MPKKHASVVGLAWVAGTSFALCFAVLVATSPRKPVTKIPDRNPGGFVEATTPVPSPEFSADQVVRLVVDAFQNNDARDSGIATAFAFASPANKQLTGPVERFGPMVKNPAYAPLLNHRYAEYGTATVRDDRAEMIITLTDAQGELAAYLFQLSKQADGDYAGCWMTDAVTRLQPGQTPARGNPQGDSAPDLDRA